MTESFLFVMHTVFYNNTDINYRKTFEFSGKIKPLFNYIFISINFKFICYNRKKLECNSKFVSYNRKRLGCNGKFVSYALNFLRYNCKSI